MPLNIIQDNSYSHTESDFSFYSINGFQEIEDNFIIKFIKSNIKLILIITEGGTIFVKCRDYFTDKLFGELLKDKTDFTIINFNEPIKIVELQEDYSIIITENNEIYFIGFFGYLTMVNYLFRDNIENYTKIEHNIYENIIFIKCFDSFIFIVTENNNLYAIGENENNQLGLEENKKYYKFTKINRFLTSDNNILFNLCVKDIKICNKFTIILDRNGNIYKCGKDIKYFTQLNLSIKIKNIQTCDNFLILLNNLKELFIYNIKKDNNEVKKLKINEKIKKFNIIRGYSKINLLILNNDNKLFYNNTFTTDSNISLKLVESENYENIQFLKDNSIISLYIYYNNNYKINCPLKVRIINCNILNYLNNINMENIFNLLNNKYLNNQNELLNLIKNCNVNKINLLQKFKSKEYDYDFSFIIIFNLILINIILNFKLNDLKYKSFKNLNNFENNEKLNIILNVIYYLINKNLQNNKKYNISILLNITKNLINNNFTILLNNLNANLDLLIYLNEFLHLKYNIQSIYQKLQNNSLQKLLTKELNFTIENPLIIDDKYLLISKLGIGGFGIVFKVLNLKTFQFLALKILFNNSSFNTLLNEFNLLSKLRHENIIEYIDFGRIKKFKYPYLVMKLCNYSLQDKLYNFNNEFLLINKLKLFLQICKGIEYLHLNNIIHRDLKLENILIENLQNTLQQDTLQNEIIKIVDFGSARQVNISKTRTINIGTELYMAPEMRYFNKEIEEKIKKEEQIANIDKPLDIYSLGCILFKLITNGSLQYNNCDYFYELLKNEKLEINLHNYLCKYLNNYLNTTIKDLNVEKLKQLSEILQRLIISIIQRNPFKRPNITIIIDIINMLINNYNNEFKLTKEQSETLLTLYDFQNELKEKDQIINELEVQLSEKNVLLEEKDKLLKEKENEIEKLKLQIEQLQKK